MNEEELSQLKIKNYRKWYYIKNRKKIAEYQKRYYLRKKGLEPCTRWKGEKIKGGFTKTHGDFVLKFD